MQEKYIHASHSHNYLALQSFAKQVAEAAREGFVVSDNIENYARVLGAASFAINMIKPVVIATEDSKPEEIQPEDTTSAQDSLINDLDQGNKASQEESQSPIQEETVDTQDGILSSKEQLKALKKKDELLSFAAELGIVVPPDKKLATAVKKFIKEQLEQRGD
jgi:hypothetical protein